MLLPWETKPCEGTEAKHSADPRPLPYPQCSLLTTVARQQCMLLLSSPLHHYLEEGEAPAWLQGGHRCLVGTRDLLSWHMPADQGDEISP